MHDESDLMWQVECAEASAVAEKLLALDRSQRGDAEQVRFDTLKERVFPRFNTLQCPECGPEPRRAAEYFLTQLLWTLADRASSLHRVLQWRGIHVEFEEFTPGR